MKHTITLLIVLQLAPLTILRAADAPISHRVLCTDYKGNRVAILSAKGEIEWEFPAKTPQDCWMLPNGNVLFSQITGAAEVTMDKKVVWEYKAPAKALVHSCQPLPDGNVLVAECVTGRLVVVGRDGKVVKEMPVKSSPKDVSHQFRGARRTGDGHYWVCLMDEMKVAELDGNGVLLREIPFDGHPSGRSLRRNCPAIRCESPWASIVCPMETLSSATTSATVSRANSRWSSRSRATRKSCGSSPTTRASRPCARCRCSMCLPTRRKAKSSAECLHHRTP
jgi:hypothetical protein